MSDVASDLEEDKSAFNSMSEYFSVSNTPLNQGVIFERRVPDAKMKNYHHHPSIEINFLQCGTMTYSFSGNSVVIPSDRLVVFWAANPHRVIDAQRTTHITNAYASLSEFLSWQLPPEFVSSIMSGAVLAANTTSPLDTALTDLWAHENGAGHLVHHRLHTREVATRLHRMAVEGWQNLHFPKEEVVTVTLGRSSVRHVEGMILFIGKNFAERITVPDVASHVGLSTNHAISIFKKYVGQTIKEHLNDLRMFHAKTLLAESDHKIASIAMDVGFGSLSAFYTAFSNSTGTSPAVFRNQVKRTKNRRS